MTLHDFLYRFFGQDLMRRSVVLEFTKYELSGVLCLLPDRDQPIPNQMAASMMQYCDTSSEPLFGAGIFAFFVS